MSNFLTLLDGLDHNVYCHSFALDSINNLYTTGYTKAKKIEIGNKTYARNSTNEAGYIAKIDKNGEIEWFHWIDGTDVLASYSVAIDSFNNVVLTGYAKSKTVLINNISYSKLNDTKDGFVIKFKPNGTVDWFNWIEGAKSDIGYKISIDKENNIIVVGLSNSDKINNINNKNNKKKTKTKQKQ